VLGKQTAPFFVDERLQTQVCSATLHMLRPSTMPAIDYLSRADSGTWEAPKASFEKRNLFSCH
jgi:hypothetical protein